MNGEATTEQLHAEVSALYFHCPYDGDHPAPCQLAAHRQWDFRQFSDWAAAQDRESLMAIVARHQQCLAGRSLGDAEFRLSSERRLGELRAAIEAAQSEHDYARAAALTMAYADLANELAQSAR